MIESLLPFPYGTPQQGIGFLDAVEDSMEIGPEQSG
jgi:hypothetical protein